MDTIKELVWSIKSPEEAHAALAVLMGLLVGVLCVLGLVGKVLGLLVERYHDWRERRDGPTVRDLLRPAGIVAPAGKGEESRPGE